MLRIRLIYKDQESIVIDLPGITRTGVARLQAAQIEAAILDARANGDSQTAVLIEGTPSFPVRGYVRFEITGGAR